MKKRYLVVLRYPYQEKEKGWWCYSQLPYSMYSSMDEAITAGQEKINEEMKKPYGFRTFDIYWLDDQTNIFDWVYQDYFQSTMRQEGN